MTGLEREVRRRRARLDALCSGGRRAARRVPPAGYDVTIYRGPLEEPVDLVVEADWCEGERATWECPGEGSGWELGHAWFRRRGTWRVVRLSEVEVRQVEHELGER